MTIPEHEANSVLGTPTSTLSSLCPRDYHFYIKLTLLFGPPTRMKLPFPLGPPLHVKLTQALAPPLQLKAPSARGNPNSLTWRSLHPWDPPPA